MGLNTRKVGSFISAEKNTSVEGNNILFVRKGSTIIEDRWIQFNSLKLDIGNLISNWSSTKQRIFNKKYEILNVLVTINKNQNLEIVPSISFNQSTQKEVVSFEDLSEKLPLVLIKLEQDGSNDLSSYKSINSSRYKIFKGYGNFTIRGVEGFTGPIGETGQRGLEGIQGLTGFKGEKGVKGLEGTTGIEGLLGETGIVGLKGDRISRKIIQETAGPIADFVGTVTTGTTIQFTNLSLGSWITLYWDFGDETSSTNENPIHTYISNGVYTVSLYLQGIDGESIEIKYDYIKVEGTSCFVQNVVDASNPSGTWESVEDSGEDTIQNVSGDCS